ncbi:D-tagatose-bisphosphate aldolase, class II, non-catalytic subunit [Geodermatophilaceae bacterium NBWT11]|nr:D-tagatose-bisphosphate aldolase, class II, non-catalytic subunit [Geodermatophilaceae bacterium NBWT11]
MTQTTTRPTAAVLDDLVAAQHDGTARGITSVCSSHPWVLEAALRQAADDDTVVLVEATSNQVDQHGGYTGMRPADFRDAVHSLADRCGLPRERVLLGGDHLGTNRWRSLPAAEAMAQARDLVAAYVRAGFTKIHLDCSYPCAGDPTPLTDELVSERAADLLAVAEATAAEVGATGELRYVVGTEVPVPGGADHALHDLVPTDADAARATLAAHRAAFAARGLADVWPQVMGLVVQPGVEFDALQVVDYRSDRTAALREVLADEPGMVFEAHSTDYQTVEALTELVADHWAVLKVGPWLTFAMREALFALSEVERELVPADEQARLPEVLEQVMLDQPDHWRGYYDGDAAAQQLARRYSYSDRARYYWPDPRVEAAADALLANLRRHDVPLPLLSAHLPVQHARVRAGALDADPLALVVDAVRDVLRGYATACGTAPSTATRETR